MLEIFFISLFFLVAFVCLHSLSLPEGLRVGGVLTLGAFAGAAALSMSLIVLANIDSHQLTFNDFSFERIFWMSIAFSLFTIPVSWFCGVPLYWLLRRFNLLRPWICSIMGAIIGVLLGLLFGGQWQVMLWLGPSCAAAGGVAALLLRCPRSRLNPSGA